MPFSFKFLSKSKALPATDTSVYTDALDLGNLEGGDFVMDCDFVLGVPALNATQLPQNGTVTYSVQHDTDPDFGTVATLIPVIAQQVGGVAGGADAQTVYFRVPSTVKQYVRIKATTASAGDCHAGSAVCDLYL